MSTNDVPGQESPGPAEEQDGKEIDVQTDAERGVGSASLPAETGAWATLKVEELVSEDTSLSVTGHWYDDEDPQVELTIGLAVGTIVLNLSPEQSQAVAEDLRVAAAQAEKGDRELDT